MTASSQPGASFAEIKGPPKISALAHVSLPCRDLDEAKRFYVELLGGQLLTTQPTYAAIGLAGIRIGLGTDGCSFIAPRMEYPHIAFYVTADEMLQLRGWLTLCSVPMTRLWTRSGVEALMFIRDPSANLLEFFCKSGLPGSADLPRGSARSGEATDIEALYYRGWSTPRR